MPDPTPDACREAFERWWADEIACISPHSPQWHLIQHSKEIYWTGYVAGAAWAAAQKEHDDDGK